MGYKSKSISATEMEDAYRRWATRGISSDDSEFIVCFFGTLGRHFDLETVVAAARKLDASGRHIKFVICGDGPDVRRWQKASATCKNLVLPGWVDAAEIQALMTMSSVGLAPYHSTWDFMISIPNKPIEYLSAGLPVVSSLKGVLANVLHENRCGLTYENGNPDDLVRYLSNCYDHPAFRNEMSVNASLLFRKRFTAEAVYAEMQDYLAGVVASSRSVQVGIIANSHGGECVEANVRCGVQLGWAVVFNTGFVVACGRH
jgi:glycosyltransferase involved in cell wall biosynthesis